MKNRSLVKITLTVIILEFLDEKNYPARNNIRKYEGKNTIFCPVLLIPISIVIETNLNSY